MSESRNRAERPEPKATRPYMPDYIRHDAESGRELLPWRQVSERIGQAQNYWLATTRPDGQPHMTPVWGVWLGEIFYFSTGPRSRKARNLTVNPHCVVSPEGADKAIIVEGVAERVTSPAVLKQVADVCSTKYQWPTEPTQDGVRDQHGNEGPVFAVRPRVVFAWDEFPQDATRWIFKAD